MDVRSKQNLSMLCDFYELTMGNGYLRTDYGDKICYFDLFFRQVPDGGGYAIAAGLEQVVDYISGLHFDPEDIDYLRGRGIFCEEFLDYLRNFRFTGDIWAVPEGTPVFPREPLITVRAPAIQAQLVETFLLLAVNHQSLIATKASRIVRAAKGRPVMEFGSRRAQGADAAILGARAAYIAGCSGTACTISDQLYGVKALGTMAHSWVQMHDSEYEAFRSYCRLYPTNAVLLVDTYNTLKSGVPNAIRAFNEVLKPLGIKKCGIRLDSGDMAYLTQQARKMLDEAGWTECTITCSNSLDEYLIKDLLQQGASIDSFGVGERLITARSEPVFGGVYKLVAVERPDGEIVPKIKISENVQKITVPHFKKIYRFYGRDNGKALADYLALSDETVDDRKDLTIFDPNNTWKRKTLTNFSARELLVPVFRGGKLVYDLPDLEEIRAYCAQQLDTLWDEVKRFENPHGYYVDLSQKLWDIRNDLLINARNSQIPEE
ncbi:MAG: nicotinate phosphoribosyltransferase [Oscillospiraceae bacterium]|nr:nicotinate phosphoribosyltransferase [Oscillospiraceae bacterium]